MVAASTSKKSVNIYQTTRPNNSEDKELHTQSAFGVSQSVQSALKIECNSVLNDDIRNYAVCRIRTDRVQEHKRKSKTGGVVA
jgi:hypothetical protein